MISKGNEVIKDETAYRYTHDEIWTQVADICDHPRYQLGHRVGGGGPERDKNWYIS